MSIFLRFKGFAMLVNTLLPFILVIGLGLLINTLYATLRAELEPPVKQLITDAENLAQHAREAANAVEQTATLVQENAGTAAEAVENLVSPLANFSISIPALNIPVPDFGKCTFNVNVFTYVKSCFSDKNLFAGVGKLINDGLKDAFEAPREEFQKISDTIDSTLTEVKKLKPLAESFRAQAREFSARAEALAAARDNIASSVADILWIAMWVIGAILIWLILSTAAWVFERLSLGWHLMRQGSYP